MTNGIEQIPVTVFGISGKCFIDLSAKNRLGLYNTITILDTPHGSFTTNSMLNPDLWVQIGVKCAEYLGEMCYSQYLAALKKEWRDAYDQEPGAPASALASRRN